MIKSIDANTPQRKPSLRRIANKFHDLSYSSKLFVAAGTLVVGGGLCLAGSTIVDDAIIDEKTGDISTNYADIALVATGVGGIGSGLYTSMWAIAERRNENVASPIRSIQPPSL